MHPRLTSLARKLGRSEKVFLILLVLAVVLQLLAPASGMTLLVGIATFAAGSVVTVRLARRGLQKVIWRLRNRLVVAYLFIAVIPILLIAVLFGAGLYAVTGQVAVYLVNSELQRRAEALKKPAEILAHVPRTARADVMQRLEPFLHSLFPDIQVLIEDGKSYRYPEDATISAPPKEWKDVNGLVVRHSLLYSWAHVVANGTEVTLAAPISHEFLSNLVPGLGDAFVLNFSSRPGRRGEVTKTVQLDENHGPRRERTPAKYARYDILVTGVSPIAIALWRAPGKQLDCALFVNTRTSAVLGVLFGQTLNWSQVALQVALVVAGLFLIAELASLIIGISITRTITRAVHGLYEGTQQVRVGDFSHRIAVRGTDQLAELANSFNTMTENLQRLIVVEKEKERLQSELEIAREVQNQLFPKNVPALRTLELTGTCHPARMVSGDYYDFLTLPDIGLALAIGDVAGKGISAALLMAAIQSTMRTQLTAGVPATVAAGGGNGTTHLSAAHLVGQLNKQLYANTSPEKYATFYFGLYDESTSILTYTNAGHLPPFLLRDGKPEMLQVTGTVVGAFPFSNYQEQDIQLKSGDLLVAYTDGVTEPENEYGEQFGEERLIDMVAKLADKDSSEIISRVMEAVEQWTASSELQDDMTMLVMRHL